MIADPAAKAPRSMLLSGTCPSYLGGGRWSTEKARAELVTASRRLEGSVRNFGRESAWVAGRITLRAIGLLRVTNVAKSTADSEGAQIS